MAKSRPNVFRFIFTLFILCAAGCSSLKTPPAEQAPVQKPLAPAAASLPIAPDFKLPDLRYGTVSLSAYKNKQPVLLFFWTSWCPYCLQDLRKLSNKYKEFSDTGIAILPINVGEPRSRIDAFAKKEMLHFNILLDEAASVAQSYEILGVPTFILIDKQGRIILTDHDFPWEELKRKEGAE